MLSYMAKEDVVYVVKLRDVGGYCEPSGWPYGKSQCPGEHSETQEAV